MKKIISLVIAIVLVVLVVGLSIKSEKRNQNDLETKQEVVIGMVTFPGYAPLYLADAKDLFPETIDVELVNIESIGDLRAALNGGSIDMYAATYDIFQASQGEKPTGVAFLAMDESFGGDGVVVREGINTLADLRGKIVGAEPGFPPYFILQYLLNQEGMTLEDVDFRDVTSADAGNAFVSGRLDVAATYEPYLSVSSDKVKDSKILVSSADTPNLIVDFLFADEDLADTNPEVLKAVAEGWFSALEYVDKNPTESYEIMGTIFGVDAQEMRDFKTGISWLTLQDNEKLFDRTGNQNAYAMFETVGDILEANGEATVRVDAEEHLTGDIIDSF